MPARRLLPPGLALLAGAAILILVVVASGHGRTISIGPLSIGVRSYINPLIFGTAAAVALLVIEWPRALWRRLGAVALAAIGSLGVVSFALSAAPIVTDADIAVSELYVELATKAELLVGPYSRFGWHHPGPMYFYLVAPFYAIAGHQAAAMYAMALAINLGAVVLIAWVLARHTRLPEAVTTIAVIGLFAWRVPRFLASTWTAHVPILASLACLVVAAAVMGGRRRLLPFLVICGSFAMQTHVSFAPLVIVIGGIAVAVLVARRDTTGSPGPMLNASAWLLACLWILPVSEAISHAGGNLAALWRFFVVEPGPGHSIQDAIRYGSYGLMGMLRPDLDLPWGGHVELTGVPWMILGSALQVGLLAVIARRNFRADRRFDGHLAIVLVGATLIAVWGLSRIRDDILSHEVFKLSALGALNIGVIAAAGVRAVIDAVAHRPVAPIVGRLGYAVVLLAVMAIGVRDLDSLTAFERRLQAHSAIVPAFQAVRDYVVAERVRKPLIRVGADRWGDAAGILLRLRQQGFPAAVTDPNVAMFSEAFVATGDEDAVVTLADPDLHRELREQPETVVLLSSSPTFVDATRVTPSRRSIR